MNVYPLRIGLYGVSGAGKTTIAKELNRLFHSLRYIDGSTVIDKVTPGGLIKFKQLPESQKISQRKKAIDWLNNLFKKERQHLIVTGHYSFWNDVTPSVAWTSSDASFYDLIIYFESDPDLVLDRLNKKNNNDNDTKFKSCEVNEWVSFEKKSLTRVCAENDIHFFTIRSNGNVTEDSQKIIELISRSVVTRKARAISKNNKSVAVFDCDGTLADYDFLSMLDNTHAKNILEIFKSEPDYSFSLYFRASVFFDSLVYPKLDFHNLYKKSISCDSRIENYFNNSHADVDSVIYLSSGLPDFWSSMANTDIIRVGGMSINAYGCIITDELKKLFVKELSRNSVHVIAFGNSSADFKMLKSAQKSFLVSFGELKNSYINFLQENPDVNLLRFDEHEC